jgi:hypothetical protein
MKSNQKIKCRGNNQPTRFRYLTKDGKRLYEFLTVKVLSRGGHLKRNFIPTLKTWFCGPGFFTQAMVFDKEDR